MNPLFEKYLLGEMSEEERTALEQAMAQDPGLREQFDRDRAFMKSLENHLLRQKIKAVLSSPDQPEQPIKPSVKWLKWISFAVIFLAISWLVWKQYYSRPAGVDKEMPTKEKSEVPLDINIDTPQVNTKEQATENKKTRGPIAQLSVEPHSLRGLRGQGTASSPWEVLVLRIWDAPFPVPPAMLGERFRPVAEYLMANNTSDAFLLLRKIEQQVPSNDTLSFLKGYCLMQMWEGEAALQSFSTISEKANTWNMEVEWYVALCHLLSGEKEEAIVVFRHITKQSEQLYRDQAKKALKLLTG